MTRATVIIKRTTRRLPAPVVVPTQPEPEYLDTLALCEWLGVSPTTIRTWRREAGFPTIEHEGFVRYRRASVVAWLDARESGGVAAIRRVS